MSEPQLVVGCMSFVVDGVTYTRTLGEDLALGRAILLQRFQTELQFDMSIPLVQQSLVLLKEQLQAIKFVDAAQTLGRLMDGTDLLGENRYRPAEILALFYNAPGEDAASTNYQQLKAKVAAWGALPAAFFIRTAFFLLADFSRSCQHPPETASEPMPQSA